MKSRSRIFIHHTAGPTSQSVRNVQDFHMDSRGWSDIAYSFLVHQDGTIYEGRGWNIQGGHTRDYNSISHAFCFIGNTQNVDPTPAALASIAWLVKEAERKYGNQLILGHRDAASTACPGEKLYAKLDYIINADTGYISPAVPTSILRKGDNGDQVRILQSLLNIINGAGLVIDGDFGPATDFAVRAYQTKLKVTSDGVWGPQTAAAHNALVEALEAQAEAAKVIENPTDGLPPVVKRGDEGAGVRKIQEALVFLGSDIVVDGDFGPATEAAVKEFQTFFSVKGGATGVVDIETQDTLDFTVAKKIQDDAAAEAAEAAEAARKAAEEAERARREAEALAEEAARQEALKEAERKRVEALAAEAAAAEAARIEQENLDLLERDTIKGIQDELDRIQAELDATSKELETTKAEISWLSRTLRSIIAFFKNL
jgi:peptidoglycan hydrolase-like protein with peptidoglycan-binding domain